MCPRLLTLPTCSMKALSTKKTETSTEFVGKKLQRPCSSTTEWLKNTYRKTTTCFYTVCWHTNGYAALLEHPLSTSKWSFTFITMTSLLELFPKREAAIQITGSSNDTSGDNRNPTKKIVIQCPVTHLVSIQPMIVLIARCWRWWLLPQMSRCRPKSPYWKSHIKCGALRQMTVKTGAIRWCINLFDPLGLLSRIIFAVKTFFQTLWLEYLVCNRVLGRHIHSR